jgi:two-component system nitrogen regulation response regulator GlnG/two-component system response regulator HydG
MSRAPPSTLTDRFSWDRGSHEPGAELLHLVICWSLDEPDRIGEAAPIEGRCILGRGDPAPKDPAPRVLFQRQRPQESVLMPPLAGSRISRVQLELAPTEQGRLSVRSVGRCAMLVGGDVVERAELEPGDTLVLRDALVLLVVRRRCFPSGLRRYPDPASFPFGRPDPHGMIGESPAAWALRADLTLAAQSGQHVLLLGQSGTGKELTARALHALSPRSGRAFVARNAATFPEGLVDAELFGTDKGYPNAGSPGRPGLIAEADGGTLFLDEIGELPAHLSSHLLRVLDREGEYQRLGDARIRRSDLRVIAATNRPIEHLKQDFAARFAIRLRVPGFEERREDIPLLLRHLLVRAAQTTPSVEHLFERRGGELAEPRIDSLLVDGLVRHSYTLHTRELERLVWLALASSHKNFLALTPELSAEFRLAPANAPAPKGAEADAIDRTTIEAALSEASGNVTDAARRLGLKNRFALYRLMKRHGLAASGDGSDEA